MSRDHRGRMGRLWPSAQSNGSIARMEIEVLRTFVEVMRRGSFAIVARDRNVEPSSVSRTIGGLEKELGVRLFLRTARRVAPTDAARAYFERVSSIVDELDGAALAAAGGGDAVRGTLRMTAAVTLGQEIIVPHLAEFSRRHPDLSFDLVLTDTFVDLVEQRIDLAVRVGRQPDSSLIAIRLCEVDFVVCASPAYLRRRGKPRNPRELESHECLRYPVPGHGPRWRFRRGTEEPFEVGVRGRVVATNGVALRACAVADMGVLMLARWYLVDELKRGTLVELFPDHRATPSEFDTSAWIVYPSKTYLPAKVRAFAEYLREKFQQGVPGATKRRAAK